MDVGSLSNSKRKSFLDRLKDPEYRHALVAAYIKNGIAFQIRSLRKAEGWDQKKLADVALGNPELQSMISRYENPDYGKYSMRTLLDFAKAFDVALEVRFIPFSQLVRRDEELPSSTLAVPNFKQELEAGSLAPSQNTVLLANSIRPSSTQIDAAFYRPKRVPLQIEQQDVTSRAALHFLFSDVNYAIFVGKASTNRSFMDFGTGLAGGQQYVQ
jgi:transcriptional regulator with XRE-family HTH domain